MLYGLDLFSGIGGITTALAPWVRPVAYCEIDRRAQSVLLSRMAEGAIPIAPIWDDIRTLSGASHFPAGFIDIIYGGFPCQNTSQAGNRKGLAGEKSQLFYEVIRLTDEIRPGCVFLENSAGVLSWKEEIIQAFRDIGYILEPDDHGLFSAKEVGAPHPRDRWWALAYPEGQGLSDWGCCEREQETFAEERKRSLCTRLERCDDAWWTIKPPIPGVDDVLPGRVDRVKSLGNAVVPLQARIAFEILAGLKIVERNKNEKRTDI